MRFIRFHFILFFTILNFFCAASVSAQINYKFEHIDLPPEVFDTKANCILEDSKGFIWFGFNSGLVLYDGYKGKIINCVQKNGIIQDFGNITSLIEDANGQLWIGTLSGVFIYNPKKETSIYLNDGIIKGKSCRSLNMTSKNEILIGTEDGLLIYDLEAKFLEQYIHQPNTDSGLSNNIVRCSYEDNNGNIWIGTYDKLNLLNRKEKKLSNYRLQQSDSLYHSNNLILSIEPLDSKMDSVLLVGTETGLCLFNTVSNQFTQYSNNESENSISNSVVKSVCKVDNQLWLGTDLGLNIFNVKKRKFQSYYYDFNKSFSISNNVINDIYLDAKRNLWIATDTGVDKIYLNSNNVLLNQFYKNSSIFIEGIVINNFSIHENGDIWIATNQGVFRYDKLNNSYEQFSSPKILHNKVKDVMCDENGLVWIATSGGLNTYDVKSKKISSYVSNIKGNNVLTTNYINSIGQDSKGTIWVGTENKGIFKIIEDENGGLKFINFKHELANVNSISSNTINDIAFDEWDNVWVATSEGINCFYILNGVFERFTNKSVFGEVPNQLVNQLFFDKDKVLWISSYTGLFQWNPKLKKFTHFNNLSKNVSSALAKDSTVYFVADNNLYYFNERTNKVIRAPNDDIGLRNIKQVKLIADKTMLLFGSKGFASVSLNDLNIKEDIPKIKWTSFSISNVEIKPYTKYNSRYIIDQNIDNVDTIILKYDENSFRVDFSSFPFNSKEAVEFKYMLEGYDSDWQFSNDGQNYVSYTQVRPGEYKLKVKGSNKYGFYTGKERVLNIVVKPPIYLSWWALLIYFSLFILLILYYRRILIQRERDSNELKIEKLDHQKSEELIELKTRFFTNITHELKTPLTLISSPVDDLLTKQLDETTLKSLLLVKRNTDRLKKLVNQILDIRKIESGGEKLLIQKYDIVKFCDLIVVQFHEEAIRRNIFIQFYAEPQSLMIWFDLEKVEKVIFNLLSNAFKFTPDKGTIRISIDSGVEDEEEDDYIYISVLDTGSGISKEDQKNIFNRFNSLSSPNYSNQKGTGIGLSLINEYAKLHNGNIKFESVLNVGSKFIFSLPKHKTLLKNYKEIDILNIEKQEDVIDDFEDLLSEDDVLVDEKSDGAISLKVLIVEDDEDMRDFLSRGMSAKYKVVIAKDGQEGFNLAIKELPNIIVSDLMMPNIDGIELCEKLKTDIRTCHIPFILLTAKSGMESKITGIETGADDYIQKPFNLGYLTVRMKNLIKQRESLKRVYIQQLKLEPSEITVNSLDENFLNDLLAKIEMEMNNSDLSVKLLSKMLGIGSTNLYRKVKALTGQTANEFIRNIRLKRAAQLLKNECLNVSEVMYMVGFTNHSYFTRCFKKSLGVSPKDYKK